ncbi:DUF998 domain-containing protein [Catellatospora paridis]|uniref:DUF998 domain-containing protein n=1 Tax=Catellatospora paridis TaxID=1617086 RepID=UPI0012D45ADC|nr:DUF998 domain-containing protein [Catellatospora paridis]
MTSTAVPAARTAPADPAATPLAGAPPGTRGTDALLAAGVVAGPLFLVATVVQFAAKTGVDPRIHPLSMLSLGAAGWLQITNFVVAGVLVLASAAGLRRALRGGPACTWGPGLIGAYGVALLAGGVFIVDPGMGYPVGAPDGPPAQLTWHGTLHVFASPLMGVALVAATFVFGRRFRRTGRQAWAVAGHAVAAAYAGLTVVGIALPDYRLMLAGGAISWLWASAVTARLIADRTGR